MSQTGHEPKPLPVNPDQNISYSTGNLEFLDHEALQNFTGLVESWTADAVHKHAQPEQQPTVTEDDLGLKFKEVSVYHGTTIPGIETFQPAEETTIGEGVYATSMPDKAFAYARARANRDGHGVVYELTAHNVSFVDLRKKENIDKFMLGFADVIEAHFKIAASNGDLDNVPGKHLWLLEERAQEVINMIRQKKIDRGLKNATWNFTQWFTDYVLESGFDGIIAYEGGEYGGGAEIGSHDSWVLMRPEQARVSKEVAFEMFIKTDPAVVKQQGLVGSRRKELGLEWWEKLPEDTEPIA